MDKIKNLDLTDRELKTLLNLDQHKEVYSRHIKIRKREILAL